MNKNSFKNSLGFTLVELLVVIAILGVLASIVLVSLNGARANARDVRRVAEISQVARLLEAYNTDNGHYPVYSVADPIGNWSSVLTELKSKGYLSNIKTDRNDGLSWLKNIFGGVANASVVGEPKIKDPLYPNRNYEYLSDLSGSDYRIRAHFENLNNPLLSNSKNGPFLSGNEPTGENACDSSLGIYCFGMTDYFVR
jgi:prepilin-type N-terminal cleavage/methylation domain-containing protein